MEVRHEDANRASIYDMRPTDLDGGELRGFSGRMPRSLVLGLGKKRIEVRATELSRCEMSNLGAPRSWPQIWAGYRRHRSGSGMQSDGSTARSCPLTGLVNEGVSRVIRRSKPRSVDC